MLRLLAIIQSTLDEDRTLLVKYLEFEMRVFSKFLSTLTLEQLREYNHKLRRLYVGEAVVGLNLPDTQRMANATRQGYKMRCAKMVAEMYADRSGSEVTPIVDLTRRKVKK